MLVVAAAKTAGALANRLHQPSVFGEILAGLILGPTVLDVLAWPVFLPPPGAPGAPLLDLVRDLAQVGVLLLMFVAVSVHFLWMLAIGTVMAIEKNVSWGNRISAPIGILLILAAVTVRMWA